MRQLVTSQLLKTRVFNNPQVRQMRHFVTSMRQAVTSMRQLVTTMRHFVTTMRQVVVSARPAQTSNRMNSQHRYLAAEMKQNRRITTWLHREPTYI